jgi:AraC family transcriptional regulator, regulatory protein of adaptative response / methylated-DNA-[protein]-cysteine methyltransferase
MNEFQRIEKAIGYIRDNFKTQPDLDEIARQVYLSPFHFQRIFKNWAGVSPKKFLQYISLEHAKELLRQRHSLADVSYEAGLSGTGRLHDLFVSIEGMTPGEFKNEGANLEIFFSFADTPFGEILIASTLKGVCHLSFADNREKEFQDLRLQYAKARFTQRTDLHQQNALKIFQQDWKDLAAVKLHLKGSAFQIKVWEALLKIPMGQVSSYGQIAASLQAPNASRAVGSAIGSNPVAFLIPCHRVIRASGIVGEYHWGSARKTAMIGWEGVKTSNKE